MTSAAHLSAGDYCRGRVSAACRPVSSRNHLTEIGTFPLGLFLQWLSEQTPLSVHRFIGMMLSVSCQQLYVDIYLKSALYITVPGIREANFMWTRRGEFNQLLPCILTATLFPGGYVRHTSSLSLLPCYGTP